MKILKLNESLYSGKIDNLYKKSILYESVKLKEESLKIINEYLEYNLEFRKKYFINYKNTFNNVFGGGSIVNPTDIEDNEIIEFELENNRFLLNNRVYANISRVRKCGFNKIIFSFFYG